MLARYADASNKVFHTAACAAHVFCMNGTSALVLLLTRDCELQREAAIAAALAGARVIVTRTVGEALQIILECHCEVDLVVSDLDDTARGMTLLSALRIPALHPGSRGLTAKESILFPSLTPSRSSFLSLYSSCIAWQSPGDSPKRRDEIAQKQDLPTKTQALRSGNCFGDANCDS